MPLYEYLCRDCDRSPELLIRGEEEQPVCPDCGGEKMMRLLSVPAAHTAAGRDGGNDGGPAGPCGSGCGCFPGG